jgi:hypothetical protein
VIADFQLPIDSLTFCNWYFVLCTLYFFMALKAHLQRHKEQSTKYKRTKFRSSKLI